jgi:two-component system, OmpR family, phosphate regulon sensor histidine kinase PhoR
MQKIRTARILMAITIALIIAFQLYWVKNAYKEEDNNFRRSADLAFKETIYRLQVDRVKHDTGIFKGMPGENLFVSNVIADAQVKTKMFKEPHKEVFISINKRGEERPDSGLKMFVKDTGMVIVKSSDPVHDIKFQQIFEGDTIPSSGVDSLFRRLLLKDGINVPYLINRGNQPDATKQAGFTTAKVPVGLMHPVFYSASFSDASLYLFRHILPQVFLSLLLVSITLVSFIFLYRNLLAQQRLTAIKNEFIGNITHELKTPLSTVSVAIEAMKNFNALNNPEKTSEYLNIAGQEVNRLSLLVDKVLRLSMFETQQAEIRHESFDMKELIETVLSSMQLQFRKFEARVHLHFKGDNFTMSGDRMHITSVIYNLLDNALKYSKGTPEINVTLQEAPEQLFVSISDNGIGIPTVYCDKVFDKFFRVPQGNTHNVKGYGLGLSYVAYIVRSHNGTIAVNSKEGEGTTFTIKLPVHHGS